MRHSFTTTIIEKGEDEEIAVSVTYDYSPRVKEKRYLKNGDPGYPEEPEQAEIISIISIDGKEYHLADLTEDDQEGLEIECIEDGREKERK